MDRLSRLFGATCLDTKEFLHRVLPSSGGKYCIGVVNAEAEYSQSWPKTIDALISQINLRSKAQENVYFATGVYEGSRSIEGARYKKALYLDLDCSGAHQGFPDKKAAILGLRQFCEDAKLPFPSIIVDSGNGIHGYWPLAEAIGAADWQVLADALKDLCEAHEFNADHAITADLARILRVPGTINWKDPANPIPCRILKATDTVFNVKALRLALGVDAIQLNDTSPSKLLAGTVGEDDLGDNLAPIGERKYYASEIATKCGVLKDAIATGGANHTGQVWYRLLHLLAFCEDGYDLIHPISKEHETYDQRNVERRFDYAMRRKASGTGPTLCQTFALEMPNTCSACPYNGRIKTPLVLGRLEEDYLPPGYRMETDGVFKAIDYDDQGKPTSWMLAFPYKISDVELVTDGQTVYIRMQLGSKVIKRTVSMPVTTFAADTKELHSFLMTEQLYPTDVQTKEFKSIMVPWMRKMAERKAAVRVQLSGLGWTVLDGKTGFATGQTMYMEDATEQMVTGLDRQLCRDYSAEGENIWSDVATRFLADGDMASTTGVLSTFAAPLISFTGISGAMLSLYSASSGTGKSSALRVAQSVWGDPQRGINALNDTYLSVTKKMGFLSNLPAYWDELRMRDEVHNLVKMIFQLGQGKERSRLNSSAKMQEMGTWSTLITVATNEPVLDHIDHIVSNTNAGRLRVFEIEVPERPLVDTELPFMLKQLDRNHGWIGREYAALLAKNAEKIQRAVTLQQQLISKETKATNDERFWVAVIAALIVGAALATRQGWLQVDATRLKLYLYRQLLIQRKASKQNFRPANDRAIDFLIQFIDENRDQIAVVDKLSVKGNSSVGVVHIQPQHGEVLAVIAREAKMIRVKRKPFQDWVYQNAKDAPSEVVRHLIAMGAKEVRSSVSVGLANTLDARVHCLDISLDAPALAGVIGE